MPTAYYSEPDERALLGAALLSRPAAELVADRTTAADYHVPDHQRLHVAIAALVAGGGAVDVQTVASETARNNGQDVARWKRIAAGLMADCPSSANAETYLRHVKAWTRRRTARQLAQELTAASAPHNPKHPDDGLDDLAAALQAAATDLERPDGCSPSWRPVDLGPLLAGDGLEASPELLVRNDGVCLLYRGKLHALNAEPESGKTFLALGACVERITLAEHVLYLDFESDAATIIERLRALGLADDHIAARFHYWRPDDPFGAAERRALDELVELCHPTLIVIDGVNEAMGLHGWSMVDNDDTVRFIKRIPRPLAATGAAVLMLDHVGRDKKSRGGFAIGAQHKKAGIDVSYELEVVEPFGRGLDGHARLYVRKDRPGHVRARCSGRERVGDLYVTSDDKGQVLVEVRTVDEDAAPFRPTHLMEKVSRALEAAVSPMTSKAIEQAGFGRASYVRQAVALLAADGFITITDGRHGSRLHVSARPFREADEEPGQ
jgi:hypothetical protein